MSGRIARILMLVSASTLCVGAFVPAGAAVSTVQRGASTLHAHKNLGTWGTATEVPGTGSFNIGGNDELDDVSCSSPGNCSGGGIYKDVAGNFQLFVVDEVGGIWGTAKEMPGSPFLNAGGDATFSQISCASAGNCAAVGGYRDISGMYQAFVVNEANSVWGVAIEVPGTPVLNAGGVAGSLSVTCPTAGNCTAGGFYSDTPTTVQAFGVSETNGNWGTAVVIPGSAALNAGGAAGLVTVKCATPGNCSADGFYTDASTHQQAFVVNQSGGVWGSATEVPGTATLNAGALALATGLSCSSAGNCSTGGYFTDAASHQQVFVASEVSGVWGTATEVPGTAALNAGGNAVLEDVSCPTNGNCTAVGYYTDSASFKQVFVVNEVGGTWGTAIEVPGSADLNTGGVANLYMVSCPSAGNCTAVGYYSDTVTTTQALVVDEVNGTWGGAIEVPGTAALNAGGDATVYALSCPTFGNCGAGGFYKDATGNWQAFAVDEVFTKTATTMAEKIVQVKKVVKHRVVVVGLRLSVSGLATPTTGTVTFTWGSVTLCSAMVANGSASCTSSRKFAKGSRTIKATYSGDQGYLGSVVSARFTVK
jgi:hypothetical protein